MCFGGPWKTSLCREHLNLIFKDDCHFKEKKESDVLMRQKRVDRQRHRGVGDATAPNKEDLEGPKPNNLFGGAG